MNISGYEANYLKRISFKLFSSEEIKKLSVIEVITNQTFDKNNHPTKGGLYDPSLGPVHTDDICATCRLGNFGKDVCPGHFGHISLPLPVFNPVLIRIVLQLLKLCCFQCHHLLIPKIATVIIVAQLQALDKGLDYLVDEFERIASELIGKESNDELASILETRLREMLNREYNLKKSTISKNNQVRNIIVKREALFRKFIQGKLKAFKQKFCPECLNKPPNLSIVNKTIIVMTISKKNKIAEEDDILADKVEEKEINIKGKSTINPSCARDHLRELWKNESETLRIILKLLDVKYDTSCPVDVFFLDVIPVTPNNFRPLNYVGGKEFENQSTHILSLILNTSTVLRNVASSASKSKSQDTVKKDGKIESINFLWNKLQILCNRLFDSDMDNLREKKHDGLKQLIEKKEGLFRTNFMGKRVNYAARSVISPDPYIMVDEIGVPLIFATKLSYPQIVTPWNIEMLKQMVMNGPNIHPGALGVIFEDGTNVRLKPDDPEQRKRLANSLAWRDSINKGCKVVQRHLIDGDVMLLNRQPTLHKPSIMAHRAKVLPKERTLRLHYANCKCYNADFDGDEMNAHLPQNEFSRAEGRNIASVRHQYLVPKDGTPLLGLIQDHILAGTLLSIKGSFFTKSDYCQLVYVALFFCQKKLKLLEPAIFKPVQLWSGKQVISTIILNLIPESKSPPTLEISAKVQQKNFSTPNSFHWTKTKYFIPLKSDELSESSVLIKNGEIICGLFDKSNIGPTHFGLIHCCYELYGGDVSTALLSAFSLLGTYYLQIHGGVTLGIEDILLTKEADNKRKLIIQESTAIGDEVAKEALCLSSVTSKQELTEKLHLAHFSNDPISMKQLDNCMKAQTDDITNKITKNCLPCGLIKKFPCNNLQLMIESGAKGGTVNALQISCLLGQIELEGRRVPLMMSGKSLPAFQPYDTSPKAGGFVTGRFLTGIRPQEFFFHCMAGREGLIDTAVKTSRSGYLQRCLIKHLEGLLVNYDSTVRDSDGSLIQFQYGEDGLDILKSQLFSPKAFSLIIKNRDILFPKKDEYSLLKHTRNKQAIEKLEEKITLWEELNGQNRLLRRPGSAFNEYFEVQLREVMKELSSEVSTEEYNKIIESWFKLDQSDKKELNFYFLPCPGPISCEFSPNFNFGVISEKLQSLIDEYITLNPDNLIFKHNFKHSDQEKILREQISSGKGLITAKGLQKLINSIYMRSLCDPGEAVGLLAAQSIGEPSTQMTLNTFHFAGRGEMNVTLGIPRLREILMTASPNISTPSMEIPLVNYEGINMERKAEQIRLRLNAVTLSDVLEWVDINEEIFFSDFDSWQFYDISFQFLPYKLYKKKFYTNPNRLIDYMENKFIKILIDSLKRNIAISSKYNLLYDHSTHTRETKSKNAEDLDEEAEKLKDIKISRDDNALSSEEEDEQNEGDATNKKSKDYRNQELGYEEPEEEEIFQKENSDYEEDINENINDDNEEDLDTEEQKLEKKLLIEAEKADREAIVKEIDPSIESYDYDSERKEWCRVKLKFKLNEVKLDIAKLIQDEAKKSYVYRIGTIKRAFLSEDKLASSKGLSFNKIIKTEGVNFLSLVHFHRNLDLNRVYSNDIHAIASTYGIEAARKAITIEIANVFACYGITVNQRHLSLIADYMTFDGTIKGMNRFSLSSNASPIQQMSFETATTFLKSSLLLGSEEDMKSPSARIFVGRPPVGGTGILGLVQDGLVVYPKSANEIFSTQKNGSANLKSRKRKQLPSSSKLTKIPNKRIKFE